MFSRQFVVFVGVGVLSATLDVSVMAVLIFFNVPYQFATTLGFIMGLIVNYRGHAKVTFRVQGSTSVMVRFGLVVLLNYFITIVSVVTFQHFFGNALIGKIISLPVIALNGFLLSKLWVFR